MSSVSGEVGHVALLLQIPDLDLGVASPGTEDQTIGMELETSINLTLNIFTTFQYFNSMGLFLDRS